MIGPLPIGMNPTQIAETIKKSWCWTFQIQNNEKISGKMRKVNEEARGICNEWSSVEKAKKHLKSCYFMISILFLYC